MYSLIKKPVVGSTLLITGCLIGAGILGLPLVSLSSGFFLSLIPLVVSWIYMYLSGLMILEIYIEEKKNINLMGLLEKTLGKSAKIIGSCLFSFLFYALLSAYFNGSSIIIKDALESIAHIELSQRTVLVFNGLFMFCVLLYGTRPVDFANRFFVFLMLISYLTLIILGAFQVRLENIFVSSNQKHLVLFAFPVFIVSFGYQNLIPTISHYLDYDVKKIKSVIFKGSGLALVMYLLWNFIILGMISKSTTTLDESNKVFLTRLFDYSSPFILFIINSFSFFAIITSLLAVGLSFVNFISDKSENQKNRFFFTACVIIPPVIFALLDPNIFLLALHIAGGIVTICLFGLLPVLMLWKTRYVLKRKCQRIFPFGKVVIGVYALLSFGIIAIEIINLISR